MLISRADRADIILWECHVADDHVVQVEAPTEAEALALVEVYLAEAP